MPWIVVVRGRRGRVTGGRDRVRLVLTLMGISQRARSEQEEGEDHENGDRTLHGVPAL
jgi:hypothetical protein